MSGFNRGSGGFGGSRYSRGDDSYGGGSSFEMYVPSQDCGKIIGRQGAKIKELQMESGAQIKVSRDDLEDGTRRVTLSGSDDQLESARNLIMAVLASDDRGGSMRQEQSYGGGGGGGGKEVITIDSSFVGRIIGKGGSRIRELQEETGCRINISRDGGRHGQTDVELLGSRYNIERAKEAIDEITSQRY